MKIIWIYASLLYSIFALLGPSIAHASEQYVFSAPPRGNALEESQTYEPIARYLTRVLGKPVAYKHPGDWLSYQTDMRAGAYDLVFDGPHFAAWRIKRIEHQPLVVLPGKLSFSVFTKSNEKRIKNINDLGGRTVCGMAPPNLATLSVYDAFRETPLRQPLIITVNSFQNGYQSVAQGKCAAGVMRDKLFGKLDKDKHMRVIHTTKGFANQGFTAGPRITPQDRVRIIEALLDPASFKETSPFQKRFNKGGKLLQRASLEEYEGLEHLLDSSWGFR
ncbi:MAG: phosphate/phosphite/phosphonate ABC transporter substrate-binding protein [Gammaproteobacteria bacterium]|nr:phosphate/phosphite/phosphonate ABC transporter substrate-binding protein [Gammaproteobacteria bacterium]